MKSVKPALDLLAQNPLLLLFVVAAIGFPLGQVRVRGVSLGVAAVLFVALIFGALDPRLKLPEIILQLGLALFVYTVGLASGPGFFAGFRHRGLKASIVGLVVLSLAVLVAIGVQVWLSLPSMTVAGGFAGALSTTPALAALMHADYGKLAGDAVVGYSIAYPLGVIVPITSMVLFLKFVKPGRADEIEAKQHQDVMLKTVLVKNPGFTPHKIRENHHVLFGRMRQDGKIFLPSSNTALKVGDELTLVGYREALEEVAALLGEILPYDLTDDRGKIDFRRVFVSNSDIVGIPLRDLSLPKRFGAIITRVRRGDLDFLPNGDTLLQPGDRVRVVAERSQMDAIAKFFGDSYKALSEIDVLSFSLGIGLGLLIGMIPIPLPGGINASLGLAGGPLLVALILGALHRTGPIVWELPYSANLTLRQVGLVLFFTCVGTRSGYAFFETVKSPVGLKMLLAFGLITLTGSLMFLVLGQRWLKVSRATMIGMLSALHTQPAALAFAQTRASGEQVNVGYATIFPVCSIAKIILAQVLLQVMH